MIRIFCENGVGSAGIKPIVHLYKMQVYALAWVITPFLTDTKSRGYAVTSIRLGGKPPFALLGRSVVVK